MYAVISLPLESRTRATFRSAELGFLGVIVLTWRQTPRLNGQPSSTGLLVLYNTGRRGLRTSWLIVGMSSVVPFPPGRSGRDNTTVPAGVNPSVGRSCRFDSRAFGGPPPAVRNRASRRRTRAVARRRS